MQINSCRMRVRTDKHDYFFVKPDDGAYSISLTDGKGNPISIYGVSRKQIYALIAQSQRAVLAEDEAKMEAQFKVYNNNLNSHKEAN